MLLMLWLMASPLEMSMPPTRPRSVLSRLGGVVAVSVIGDWQGLETATGWAWKVQENDNTLNIRKRLIHTEGFCKGFRHVRPEIVVR